MSKKGKAQPDQLSEYQAEVAEFRKLIDRAADYHKLQLSNKALQAMLRGMAPKAVQTLVELLDSTYDNVRLGAAKALLAKTMPDLRAVELSSSEDIKGLVIIRQDTGEVLDAEVINQSGDNQSSDNQSS